MTPRAAIQALGRMVRDDMRAGHLSDGAQSVGDVLAEQPDALLLIVDVTAAEVRKKRPDDALCRAYSFMLGKTLERLRQRVEAGQAYGVGVIDQLRKNISAQLDGGKLPPVGAIALAHAFTRSGIDVGDGVRRALDDAMAQRAGDGGGGVMPDPTAMLKELAVACDGDPFSIHSEYSGMIAAAPSELQLTLLSALVQADEASLREAAVGWLLAEPVIATPLVSLIEEAAGVGLVSATSLTHLMLMRNWVTGVRRTGIDAIIKAARSKGVTPQRRAAIQIREILISERDGAGAQSVFAAIKEGRKHALVSILVKQDHGVRDAWVASGLGKAELDGMLARINAQMPHHDAVAEDVALLIGAALADGVAAGRLPPFGLVQAVTLIGLSDVAPAEVAVADLVSSLLADLDPALTRPRAVDDVLRHSGQWLATNPQLASWFETGDDATAVTRGKRKRADRVTAIMNDVLQPRRRFWARVIAWSAFARRGDGDGWIDMALVAREFVGERPLAEIPLAKFIAMQTEVALSG